MGIMIKDLITSIANRLVDTHNLKDCKVKSGKDMDTYEISCTNYDGNKVLFIIRSNGQILHHYIEHKTTQNNKPKETSWNDRDFYSNDSGTEYVSKSLEYLNKSMFISENPIFNLMAFQYRLNAVLQSENSLNKEQHSIDFAPQKEIDELMGKNINFKRVDLNEYEKQIDNHIRKSIVNY